MQAQVYPLLSPNSSPANSGIEPPKIRSKQIFIESNCNESSQQVGIYQQCQPRKPTQDHKLTNCILSAKLLVIVCIMHNFSQLQEKLQPKAEERHQHIPSFPSPEFLEWGNVLQSHTDSENTNKLVKTTQNLSLGIHESI